MDKIHNGLAKQVSELLFKHPDKAFCTQDIASNLNLPIKSKSISLAVRRLYHRKKVIRTQYQLAKGFYYSVSNQEVIDRLNTTHLLPYDFKNNRQLIDMITKTKFNPIRNDKYLNFSLIRNNDFVKKYGLNLFMDNFNQQFIAGLIGFCMTDGHILHDYRSTSFYFRYKLDAEKFCSDFNRVFHKEKLTMGSNDFCYNVKISSVNFSKLLVSLGTPKGNKVLQPFLVPRWILYGRDDIKLSFLKNIYEGEGSAPTNNRWRIQFVISKRKESILNLIQFENQIRQMLYHFGITTSHIQLRTQKGRHFNGRFYIKGKENLRKFYNLLEFSYASEKQEVLKNLIIKGNSFRSATVRGFSEHHLNASDDERK